MSICSEPTSGALGRPEVRGWGRPGAEEQRGPQPAVPLPGEVLGHECCALPQLLVNPRCPVSGKPQPKAPAQLSPFLSIRVCVLPLEGALLLRCARLPPPSTLL